MGSASLSACIRIGCAALLAAAAACAAHFASAERGVVVHDRRVVVFRADRRHVWSRFRLGAGLNVVVANARLPRRFGWRVETGGISSSPTVMDTTVLVTANDDHLYAIDGATGTVRWRYRAENELMSQPAYAHGLVYVGTGNNEDRVYDPPHFVVTGEGINKLEAVDARTGVEQWFTGLAGTGMPSQAILGGNVIAADGAGTVLAVDARTGEYRWHVHLPSVFDMSSVTDGENGRLYLSGRLENAVYAIDERDGAVEWKHEFGTLVGAIGAEPLAQSGSVLVGMYLAPLQASPRGVVTAGARARQHVFALDRHTGVLCWDTPLAASQGSAPSYNEASIPLIYDRRAYLGSSVAPVVTALDLHGGVVWQRYVAGPVKGGIVARDGVLYFGDLSGHLWALRAKNGSTVGSIATDMSFNTGSPIIVNDSLVLGGRSDVLAVPLDAIRDSQEVPGVTSLTLWEHIGRLLVHLVPHRDPHREAGYGP